MLTMMTMMVLVILRMELLLLLHMLLLIVRVLPKWVRVRILRMLAGASGGLIILHIISSTIADILAAVARTGGTAVEGFRVPFAAPVTELIHPVAG